MGRRLVNTKKSTQFGAARAWLGVASWLSLGWQRRINSCPNTKLSINARKAEPINVHFVTTYPTNKNANPLLSCTFGPVRLCVVVPLLPYYRLLEAWARYMHPNLVFFSRSISRQAPLPILPPLFYKLLKHS
ncbi:uncharacterized protein LY79DRAFT_536922 [Colletotrichum navitas]|uniref:Uncharacterized protein n=1 Tax=Colletotrichum navitas TaxID=681940 RepID=A0AAD8QDK9_9PEZI|nr:uncharacterized protein LY79DRAFT_536922 [Colletotrichum navitas]KAK1599084.1 hypothetical protein LY79DRAFT_536922 [Colletotrichum navitas]